MSDGARVERKAAEKKEKELARREEAKAKRAQGRKGRGAALTDVKKEVCEVHMNRRGWRTVAHVQELFLRV